MSHPALRAGGILILGALAAVPAMTAGAATQSIAPSSVSASSSSAPGARKHIRHRRGRRLPPGGCYARNAIVLDPKTGEVLFEKDASSSVPIASLSKLMTDQVFLEQQPALDREVEVTRAELKGAGHTRLRNHEKVALGDLLHMSLMCSDNCATRVLVRESGLPLEDFLARMNRKSIELGMSGTRFVECTGLDQRNVSTASDVARMLRAAAENSTIQEITTMRAYEFHSARRMHEVHNTNRMLYGKYEILGGKTGFIHQAGYCFATWVHTETRDLIAVVLGAPTAATRFADVRRLVVRTTSPEHS